MKPKPEMIYRHRLITRVSHWLNLFCILFLLMSGLQIFNAHPRLYWGQYGADFDKPFLEMLSGQRGDETLGLTKLGGMRFITTGLFGVSGPPGQLAARGFPAWATLPSWQDLATGRRWHFFFAWIFVLNGLLYLLHGAFSGHFRKDLALSGAEVKPRHVLKDILDHIRLKHPTGEAAKRYNTLQKFTYLMVIFVLLPLMVLTGLTMSPGMNAFAPWLLDLFGGRQSARSIHFISASLIVLFVVVHVVEVFIAGVWNEMRSMITGWYAVKADAGEKP
jgi:thiosulfate reductase cytochrome b subunit